MQKDDIDIINLYIKLSRKVISTCCERFIDFNKDIVDFLGVNDTNSYGFIIDSYYLLEDTQLAKQNFIEFGTTGPTKYRNFGEVYLRVYGVLNACYLQQQAIIEMLDKLNIPLNKKELKNIKEFSLFELRNIFAAHTVNRGYKRNKRSYILDRYGLLDGKLKGYSINHKTGREFKDADIDNEISKWNALLVLYLKRITYQVVKNTDSNPIFKSVTPKYSEVFKKISEIFNGNCFYPDVWEKSNINIKINYVSAKKHNEQG